MRRRHEEEVREFFDQDAESYLEAYKNGLGVRSVPFQERKQAVEEMFTRENLRVLDVGSGPGVFTEFLLKRKCQIWMLDISKEMIKQAILFLGEHFPQEQIFCLVGSIEYLPFPDHFFDSCLCVGVIEYVENLERALKELARVIRPGGELILTAPNKRSFFFKLDHLVAEVINRGFGWMIVRIRGRRFFEYPFYHRVFDPEELVKTVESYGFSLSQQRFTNFRTRILRGFFQGISNRMGGWLEKRLNHTRLRTLGTNFIAKFERK